MAREICCVNSLYFEYNVETQQVCSPVLGRKEFEQWYSDRYMSSPASRRQNYKDFQIRLARVQKTGTSATSVSNLQQLVRGNLVGSFSEWCAHVVALAEAPAEPEIKFAISPKEAQLRIDREIANWDEHAKRNHDNPKEVGMATNCADTYRYVRSMLFGG